MYWRYLILLSVTIEIGAGLPIKVLAESTKSQSGAEKLYVEFIKPRLRTGCYSCHGALKQEAGLRLDTARLIMTGGDSGSAIELGDPDSSLLLQRVSEPDEDLRMPPQHEAEPLDDKDIKRLRDWIAQGAPAPKAELPEPDPRDHWALQPIERPEFPQARHRRGHPVDALVFGSEAGLPGDLRAERLTQLRRLYIDLIGIPPTLQEITAFEAATSETAYQQLVDRLLQDPRHGERWARHWMDIWRYSDWWGLGMQLRNSQHHMWHWRDWIVESLNDDLPYDEMVRQMLAADELYPGDSAKARATGFLARNYNLFNRDQWMTETVEHVGKGLLGLTLNCAKCHDHKYDPISQANYYQMRAFFEPYHVRLDMVPGTTDFTRNGIPRVFDSGAEMPTYLLVRGNENTPDKSRPIAPGLPDVFTDSPLDIRPVKLPTESWQPGTRREIVETHLAAAQELVSASRSAEGKARQRLASVKHRLAKLEANEKPEPAAGEHATDSEPIVRETFQSLDAEKWKLFGGQWENQAGKLSQKMDGPKRSVLRWLGETPRDFEASIRYTTLGGSRWQSVGIAFDDPLEDPIGAAGQATELFVYASGVKGGSKVQVAYRENGSQHYPAEAREPRQVLAGTEHTLSVRVRDRLINVQFDGKDSIAWQSPISRRSGSLQVTVFDAITDLHEFTLSKLSPNVSMRVAGNAGSGGDDFTSYADGQHAVADAELELSYAASQARLAEASEQSVASRAAALTPPGRSDDSLRLAAIESERLVEQLTAQVKVNQARLALHRAEGEGKEKASKELASAESALTSARDKREKPILDTDQVTPLAGARWTPTRFLNSGKDDPEVKFTRQSTGRRRALAHWITSPSNPLAARVAVNHIWLRHIGEPLVPTVFNFGRSGASPTHPQLLDWLARELIDSGWSMKHLHRLIVTSDAYRMRSGTRGSGRSGGDKLLRSESWHRASMPLEAQVLRDAILSHAGMLDGRLGGPSVAIQAQNKSARRSLYFFHSNNHRHLFLSTFDDATVNDCYQRDRSIVPQQVLALANSDLVDRCLPNIAQRLSVEGETPSELVARAFIVLLGYRPSQQEISSCLSAMAKWRTLPGGDDDKTVRENLIWTLMNHGDFVTLR